MMISPDVFGLSIEAPAADSSHLVGALVVTVAVIALAEVVRAGRWLYAFMGLWLIASPFFLSGGDAAHTWSSVPAGAVLIGLSIPRGKVGERYGGWDGRII
jgi:hypothetical protein